VGGLVLRVVIGWRGGHDLRARAPSLSPQVQGGPEPGAGSGGAAAGRGGVPLHHLRDDRVMTTAAGDEPEPPALPGDMVRV